MKNNAIKLIMILLVVQGCARNPVKEVYSPEITSIPTSIPLSTTLPTAEITPTHQLLYPQLIDRCADMKIADFEDFSFAKNTRAIYLNTNDEGDLDGYFLLSVDDKGHSKTEDLDVLNEIEVYFSDLAISPDGQKILYTILDEKFNYHIKILNIDDQSLFSDITIEEEPAWLTSHAYWLSEKEILIVVSYEKNKGREIFSEKAYLYNIFTNQFMEILGLDDVKTLIFSSTWKQYYQSKINYYIDNYSILYGNLINPNNELKRGFYIYNRDKNYFTNIFKWTNDFSISMESLNSLYFKYAINIEADQIINYFSTTDYGFEAIINTTWSVVENLESPPTEIHFPFPFDAITENRVEVFDSSQKLIGFFNFPTGYLNRAVNETISDYNFYFYDWEANKILDYCLTNDRIGLLPYTQIYSEGYFSYWNEIIGETFIINLSSGEYTSFKAVILDWVTVIE